ncbi:MAG: M28 family peptidase [Flavobacteriales bacterium]|nr:M28 family peptidase [Flavobacteriales bacterium]
MTKQIARIFRNALLLSLLLTAATQAEAQKVKWKEKRAAKRLYEHIAYLSSDQLEGRSTGSQGEKMSADYLAAEFEKLGLKPLGIEGSYLQPFDVVTLRIADASGCKLKIGDRTYAINSEFYPISYSSNNASVQGEAVDCGYGINSAERNDFEGKDLKGKVAVINASSPDGIHPHSKWSAYHGTQIRVDQAIKSGAVAVLFWTNDKNMEEISGELSTKMQASSVPVFYVMRSAQSAAPQGNVEIQVRVITDADRGHNVLGFVDNGAKYTVVIGAHHDHLGRGEHGGSLSAESNDIHNGADDNASGSAGLLELARTFKKKRKWNRNYNYLFAAFSGEEMGLLGSKYLIEHFPMPLDQVNCMLNMDMVGMLDSNHKTLIINGVGSSPFWLEGIQELEKDAYGIDKIKTTASGIGASDHTSFYLSNIPSVHFFTGQHKYYHKPDDDIEHLNMVGEVRVLQFMKDYLRLINGREKMTFTKTKDDDANQRRSFKVTLGIIPDYVFDGEGVRVDGVKEGKPGALAGLQAGDIIISLNGSSVKAIQDYMKILGELEEGVRTKMQVNRQGEVVELEVQF